MAAPEPVVGEYVYAATMDEVLREVSEHIDWARHAENDNVFHMRLMMANKAMRAALAIYRDRLALMVREKEEK